MSLDDIGECKPCHTKQVKKEKKKYKGDLTCQALNIETVSI